MSNPISNGPEQRGKTLPFQMDHLPEYFQKKSEIELNEKPENKSEKLQELKTLIAGDPATNDFDFEKDLLVQYLRHSKYDVQRAFKHIQNYVALRSVNSHLFQSIPDEYFHCTNSVEFILPLPERSPEGCTIIVTQTGKWNPDEMVYEDLVRLSMMTYCQLMRDPMTQINGFKVIHDFKDTKWEHYKYCTPRNLRFLFHATIDCFPARYKEIHFINESFVMRIVWSIIKRFLSAKIRSRVFLHSSTKELLEYFPRSLLPVEYGGDLQLNSMKEWSRKANKNQETNTIKGQPNFY
ncbi:retinaldehyde-binding protein 1-like [Argiope bruennichi]|uniref:Retinaldehyde-binding protein 1 like protein n=1 Tax=Argiope bruennichi TaxID=94029 RepID=A0A8T0EVL8_ARGBR|nr:retinaldehyde-binding protein 1-like [Argiope bruennichi]XP_055946402.1 retinaldehyde-binding protein 1-like [Argiope bruennichi]XP_055946403.1 retinaldehyde-binding protein 1-like [Argiope bruennichi]KAF8778436.1 Retinaldehyde-binding protein 1 like protein [Argiope bruennichi]